MIGTVAQMWADVPPVAPPWNPASIGSATLVSDTRASAGLTYNAGMRLFGTGPAITLTNLGPYAAFPGAIRVQIIDPTHYNVSLNSGRDWLYISTGAVIPNGGSVAIPGSPVVLNFAAGVYVATALYISQTESLADQSGNGFTFGRSTAPVAQLGALNEVWGRGQNGFSRKCRGVMGLPAVVSNADAVMDQVGTWAATLFGGVNKGFDLYWIGALNNITGGTTAQMMVSATRSTAGFPYRGSLEQGGGSFTYQEAGNTDGNVPFASSGGVSTPPNIWHLFRWYYDPATTVMGLDIDGVNVITRTAAIGAATTLNRGALFGFILSGTVLQKAIFTFSWLLAYSTKLSAPDAATVSLEMRKSTNNLPVAKAGNIYTVGDSYAAGSLGEQSFSNIMLWGNDLFASTLANAATPGWNVANLIATAGATDSAFNPGAAYNFLIINIGVNDIQFDGLGDEATLRNQLRAYIAARKAAHPWTVFLNTIIPVANGFGNPPAALAVTKQNDQNNWRRLNDPTPLTGGPGHDALFDYASIWPSNNVADLLYYAPDQVHPSEMGGSFIAALLEVAFTAKRPP